MNADELERLYMAATGNRTAHGARRWAADVLGVDERTIRRWLAGETRPARLQLARLRVRAAIAERARAIAAERRAGRGWWAAVRRALKGFDKAVLQELERRRAEYLERLSRDPGSFADGADWAGVYERVHGRRPTLRQLDAAARKIVPPAGRGDEWYAALPWLAQRRRLIW